MYAIRSYYAKTKEAMLKKMQQQYGLSSEDAAKMKNSKDLTKEEKKALANKVMNQQTNMSMEDVKNLKNMSESGKKAYAQSIATESMAVQESNSQNKATRNNFVQHTLYEVIRAAAALEAELHHRGTTVASLALFIESEADLSSENLIIADEDLKTDFDGGLAYFDSEGYLLAA